MRRSEGSCHRASLCSPPEVGRVPEATWLWLSPGAGTPSGPQWASSLGPGGGPGLAPQSPAEALGGKCAGTGTGPSASRGPCQPVGRREWLAGLLRPTDLRGRDPCSWGLCTCPGRVLAAQGQQGAAVPRGPVCPRGGGLVPALTQDKGIIPFAAACPPLVTGPRVHRRGGQGCVPSSTRQSEALTQRGPL